MAVGKKKNLIKKRNLISQNNLLTGKIIEFR